jgi:Ethanolamine utilization protein EutJ (predicted chaperonin)
VDGGPEPHSDLIEQAERGMVLYSGFDLGTAAVVSVKYDNDAQRFRCTAEDAQGGSFEIFLIYGDGLIMPERLD